MCLTKDEYIYKDMDSETNAYPIQGIIDYRLHKLSKEK